MLLIVGTGQKGLEKTKVLSRPDGSIPDGDEGDAKKEAKGSSNLSQERRRRVEKLFPLHGGVPDFRFFGFLTYLGFLKKNSSNFRIFSLSIEVYLVCASNEKTNSLPDVLKEDGIPPPWNLYST